MKLQGLLAEARKRPEISLTVAAFVGWLVGSGGIPFSLPSLRPPAPAPAAPAAPSPTPAPPPPDPFGDY